MTEQDLRAQMNKGERIARLLEDDEVKAAFTRLTEIATTDWKSSSDSEIQLQCWNRVNALEALHAELQSIVTTGKLASEQLKRGRK